jgi:hypothetical protein
MSHIFSAPVGFHVLQFLQAAIALVRNGQLIPAHSGNMAHDLHLALGQIMSHISLLTGINWFIALD